MSNVDDFITNLPAHERRIMEVLRGLVLDNLPDVRERLSYGVPFYYLRHRLCYLWPASVKGSGAREGVVMGFVRGHLLSNEDGLLHLGKRKEVSNVVFTDVRQIDREALVKCLLEAAIVDMY